LAQFTRQKDVPIYSNYTKYRPYLRADFRKLCAYCERPEKAIGGTSHCEIDHFKPRGVAPDLVAVYDNLYYCCRACNSRKSEKWSSKDDLNKGRRFSNPCKEDFYETHCVEIPDGSLRFSTECGRYTRDAIFLNRAELIEWRAERRQTRRDIGVFLQLRTELSAERIAETNARTVKKIEKRIIAIDGFVKRSRAMYGL
jgi:uncharacterized protein (TIGR02646 family)